MNSTVEILYIYNAATLQPSLDAVDAQLAHKRREPLAARPEARGLQLWRTPLRPRPLGRSQLVHLLGSTRGRGRPTLRQVVRQDSRGPALSLQIMRAKSVCYERSETAAGFSAEDLKRAEAQWREQGSPKGLTSD